MAAARDDGRPARANMVRRPGLAGGHPAAWLGLVSVACLLPFVGRAFHIDDPLFVWAADHIRRAPLDFYGFTVNWTLTADAPMYQVTRNPPLVPYLIALVRTLFGESEVVLHLAFWFPALAVVLGTHQLARDHSSRPELAALATLLTPVFLVSATTVMSDVTMLAFWIWSVVLWDRGMRGDRPRLLAGAALLVGLAFLSKYFAVALVPLLLVHGISIRRRVGAWTLWLLLPVGVVLCYELVTYALYGAGLFGKAVLFASRERPLVLSRWLAAGVNGLVFAGGCLFGVVFFGPWTCPRPLWWGGLGLAAAGIAAAVLCDGSFGPGDGVALQRWLFFAIGAFVSLLLIAEVVRRPDPTSLLLALWIGGTLCFATWFNWALNGRSILPLAPAVGLLLARRVDARLGDAAPGGLGRVAWPLVPAACVALAVAWADTRQADADRRAAREVAEKHGEASRPMWCAAIWGFKYYMERSGARLVDASGAKLATGDLLVSPVRLWRQPELSDGLERVDRVEVRSARWLATMERSVGAGFHAASFARKRGPLPFAVGRVPPSRFYVMAVTRPLLYRDALFRAGARREGGR